MAASSGGHCLEIGNFYGFFGVVAPPAGGRVAAAPAGFGAGAAGGTGDSALFASTNSLVIFVPWLAPRTGVCGLETSRITAELLVRAYFSRTLSIFPPMRFTTSCSAC